MNKLVTIAHTMCEILNNVLGGILARFKNSYYNRVIEIKQALKL